MKTKHLVTLIAAGACAVALTTGTRTALSAQAPRLARSTSADLGGFLSTTLIFTAADANKDGVVTRDELRTTVEKWVASAEAAGSGTATREQLMPALNTALPISGLAAAFNMGGRGGQPQTPDPLTVERMMAALPAAAPARPQQPRKVLVLAKAGGFVHSTIPLAAKTIEALGTKTGAWSTTITYDAASITTENLKSYDAIFLASTTGAFLDAPGDTVATETRRQALLAFVRGGKGIAGIHAASDSYHASAPAPGAARGAGANPLASFASGPTLAPVLIAQGDRNGDDKLDRAEATALASAWFDAIDTNKSGRLIASDFALLALYIPKAAGVTAAKGPDTQTGTWPDFNRLIGGYFKFHWLDPQQITMKVDDTSSPLTRMFTASNLVYHDEIYTMGAQSFSRQNVRVLTSIDYAKMSAADKALEDNPRTDGDYGLSWIRREGQGRVFYEALGHSERIYANRAILEHLLAGMQYAIGDLKADDAAGR